MTGNEPAEPDNQLQRSASPNPVAPPADPAPADPAWDADAAASPTAAADVDWAVFPASPPPPVTSSAVGLEEDWLFPELGQIQGQDPTQGQAPAPNQAPGQLPAAEPFPSAAAAERPLWRPIAALLCFAAAILTLFGSFLDLFRTSIGDAATEQRIVLTITSWTASVSNNGIPDVTVPAGLAANNGPPLVFAATALLAAALLGLLVAAAPGSGLIARIGALTAVGAVAFLAGTTWTITMEELSLLDRFRPPASGSVASQVEYDTSLELGYWLLVGANAAAIAGLVLALLPLRRRLRRRAEPETPPMGFAAPMGFAEPVVVHRLPDAPADGSP